MLVTMVIPILAKSNVRFSAWINDILTGRIEFVNQVYHQVWTLPLGQIPKRSYDNMYFNTLFNYGWIILVLCLVVYTIGIWYSIREEQYYITIALSITALYGYMELLPLSVIWNLPMVYLAQALFKGRTVVHEQL